MSKKMRIQLLSPELVTESDRLVDQTIEFYNGPKEEHKGPIKIEVILEGQSDVDKVIDYLKKLAGQLPIEQKTTQGRKPAAQKPEMDSNSREILLTEAVKASKNQDDFIKYLRERDFVFITSEHLATLLPESYKIPKRKLEKFEWLIRCTKLAKDPRADKFDMALFIGIKILSERDEVMIPYMNGEKIEKITLEVPENAMGFKKTNLIKYPHYMTYEEREKWGVEHRALLNNPDKAKTKFYLRWEKDVKLSDEQKPKK